MPRAAGLWLTSKLMPSIDNDVISSPGLAIRRKWVSSQYGTDPTCCLSVIRDTAFGSPDEVISGTSAILFLISESVSWKLHITHLHNLLMSIPSGAHLFLLILCGSYDNGFSSVIMNELGLQDIDKSRVSGFQLVYLIENQQEDHGGFFSDRRLREGLLWLAGESPSQPTLDCVYTRELVQTHLNFFSGVHDTVNYSKLGPNDCISLFNEAIECSLQEVIAAANSNPAGWPCPEIGLIDKSCDEDRVVERYLPTLGWSSNLKTDPIICAFQNCKLPAFQDDLSWLARGSKVGHEIVNQKMQLENCLIHYLTHSSNMMGVSLARKEASVTVQTCVRLELYGSDYRLVPHWGMIFRRIFNWRLMGLSSGEISMTYISKCHHAVPNMDLNVGYESRLPSSNYLNPSLDEMISVNFSTPLHVNDQPGPGELGALPQRRVLSVEVFHQTVNLRGGQSNLGLEKLPMINRASKCGFNTACREELMNGKPTKESEKLRKLLEQCKLLQDGIDKKLYVYFGLA